MFKGVVVFKGICCVFKGASMFECVHLVFNGVQHVLATVHVVFDGVLLVFSCLSLSTVQP